MEVGEINAIAKIYGLNNKDQLEKFKDSVKEVAAVTTAAKAIISNLKNIPGINIAGSIINAIVAGSMVAGLGECTVYAMEQVYLGRKTLDDVDWIKKLLESKFSQEFIERITKFVQELSAQGKKIELKDLVPVILDLFDIEKKKINKK